MADRRARRREAELAALRIAQGDRIGRYIISSNNYTAVWAWDEEAVERELERAECEDLSALPRAPETMAVLPELATSGVRLVACQRGVEGQVWRDGALIASRWWAQSPDVAEWDVFGAAVGVDNSTPTLTQPTPLARPWRANEYRESSGDAASTGRLTMAMLLATAAVLFAGLSLFVSTEFRHQEAKARLANLSVGASAARKAQVRVQESVARQAMFAKAFQGVDGLMIMNSVASASKAAAIYANSIEMRDNRVAIYLPRDQLSKTGELLSALNATPIFADARLSTGNSAGDEIEVDAKIRLPAS